ncbi:unnamed protein product [Arabis nemorensis]|uniref:Uncharacterized protein n=1 Tax=Arabis nemorensis TaxID=586526 RepID=A0A565BCC1_9BRAS|nr:unnamed protein product [Arabis nemorensis]
MATTRGGLTRRKGKGKEKGEESSRGIMPTDEGSSRGITPTAAQRYAMSESDNEVCGDEKVIVRITVSHC